jgi:glutamyl-tRNA(Gln) amidotransferase subunit D
MRAAAGDKVVVETFDEKIEGVLLESQKKGVLILKLANGYNRGIDEKKVKKVTVVAKAEVRNSSKVMVQQNRNLPKVTILHTGGTIASKVDYKTGAVVARYKPEELVASIPELAEICNVESILVSSLQSESMRFGHYNLMARAVLEALKGKPKGIIITHGTDTLHYSAAALSFMFENLPVPVILVGAQRSSDRGSSDAAMNIVCAAKFIVHSDFKGVAICMHKNMNDDDCVILPGTKSRKLHTSRRDAFKAVNTEIIAEVGYKTEKVAFHTRGYEPTPGKVAVKYFKENIKVGLLKTHTNTYPEDYAYFKKHVGLVIEGTGLGHAQTTGFDKISSVNEKNKKALAGVAKKAVVVLCSQCIFGRVNMNVYSPQRELLEIGVLPGDDMTAETAFIKLAWLLSNYPKAKVRELIGQNLRGEIMPRTQAEEDFLE